MREALRSMMKIALAGTGTTAELPETGVPALDALLGSMSDATPERLLLDAAGILAIYAQAGTVSIALEDLPPAADADDLQTVSARATAILGRLLEGDLHTLLPGVLAFLKEKRVRLPEALLPGFLDVKDEYRSFVRPVLGRRGLWLAGQNADWRWGLDEEDSARCLPDEATDFVKLERAWHEGDTAERLEALRRVRAVAPDRARSWIEETWKKDKADQRAAFVEALGEGLGPADAPFLESIAKDRSQKIRSARFLLLATLPDSSISRGLEDHTGFLQVSRPASRGGLSGLLQKLSGKATEELHMEVRPPEQPDVFWQEAGLSARPPQGIGLRAWLLQQMLSLIPLKFWEGRFDASPDELTRAARKTEWQLPILEGWTRSAMAMPAGPWLSALVAWWKDFKSDDSTEMGRARLLVQELLPGLVGAAAPEHRTALVELLLSPRADPALPWTRILSLLDRPWPARLGSVWLQALHQSVDPVGDGRHADWLATLPMAAGALPEECLREASQQPGLPERQDNESWSLAAWRRAWDDFLERVELRCVIWEEVERSNMERRKAGDDHGH